jgi:hypothetical protein
MMYPQGRASAGCWEAVYLFVSDLVKEAKALARNTLTLTELILARECFDHRYYPFRLPVEDEGEDGDELWRIHLANRASMTDVQRQVEQAHGRRMCLKIVADLLWILEDKFPEEAFKTSAKAHENWFYLEYSEIATDLDDPLEPTPKSISDLALQLVIADEFESALRVFHDYACSPISMHQELDQFSTADRVVAIECITRYLAGNKALEKFALSHAQYWYTECRARITSKMPLEDRLSWITFIHRAAGMGLNLTEIAAALRTVEIGS